MAAEHPRPRRRIYPGNPEVGELARDTDDVLEALWRAMGELQGGGAVSFGSPVALAFGGGNVDGVATTVPRSDHQHALPVSGNVNDVLDGTGTFRTMALSTVYDGRVVPAGLHAKSDEWDVDTIGSGKWTLYDHGGAYSAAVETGMRRVRMTRTSAAATNRTAMLGQAIPSNTFTFLGYVAMDREVTTVAPGIGLCVGQDFTSATGDIATLELVVRRSATSGAIQTRVANDYTVTGTVTTRLFEGPTVVWLRMRVAVSGGATTVDCDYSSDGVHWVRMNQLALGYAVQHFGVSMFDASGTAFEACYKHFRVFDGTAAYGAGPNGGYLAA